MSGRAHAPQPDSIRPYEFPAVETERIGNRMGVRVVRSTAFPIVTAMIVFRSGETAVPAGQGGLAVLTGSALEGGTTRMSSRELARELEDIGAGFGVAAGWDSTTAAVSCMAGRLDNALPLLAEMVRRPAFRVPDFERYRAQRLAAAAHRRMDPASLANDSYARFVFGGRDSYRRPLAGTEGTLAGLGPDDAHRFALARYGPEAAVLIVAGDVEPVEVLSLAEREFGGWDRATDSGPEPRVSPRRRERAVRLVHRPGSVQSEIRVGHVGVARSVEDYLPLMVLNLVLGGSFSSRLNLNLRERNGFTYGVRSRFTPRRGAGPFVVSTSVENAVTGAAVREIVGEIEGLAESGPTPDEVEAAKSYMAGVFPLRMETTGQIASGIAQTVVFDLPSDYYRSYRSQVRKVTREEAAESARRHIRPAELCTVIVGDADEVAPQLESLGAGPVSVRGEAPEEVQ